MPFEFSQLKHVLEPHGFQVTENDNFPLGKTVRGRLPIAAKASRWVTNWRDPSEPEGFEPVVDMEIFVEPNGLMAPYDSTIDVGLYDGRDRIGLVYEVQGLRSLSNEIAGLISHIKATVRDQLCPSCRAPLRARTNSRTQEEFFGCEYFNSHSIDCRFTKNGPVKVDWPRPPIP